MKLDSAVFYTNDLERITAFYRDTLGLKVDYIQEGKFASFWFDNNVRLGIKKAVEEREKPGGQTIFISVENIDELFKKYKQMNLTFYKELTELDWGKQFSLLDPDGNKVLFVERASV